MIRNLHSVLDNDQKVLVFTFASFQDRYERLKTCLQQFPDVSFERSSPSHDEAKFAKVCQNNIKVFYKSETKDLAKSFITELCKLGNYQIEQLKGRFIITQLHETPLAYYCPNF